MDDWVWAVILLVAVWAALQIGWLRGYEAGKAPWEYSHGSNRRVKT